MKIHRRRQKGKKNNVPPGNSVGVSDFTMPQDDAQVKDINTTDFTRNQNLLPVHRLMNAQIIFLYKTYKQLIFTSSEDEQESKVAYVKPSDTDLSSGDYAVVKVYVCDLEDNGYVGVFLKKVLQTNKFTVTNEESFFSREDIVRKLSITTRGTTSRFKDMIIFKDDVSDIICEKTLPGRGKCPVARTSSAPSESGTDQSPSGASSAGRAHCTDSVIKSVIHGQVIWGRSWVPVAAAIINHCSCRTNKRRKWPVSTERMRID
ncbi:hypothetical protein PR048_010012 [Dryococelus australis]|uniref:Uncharacterized protein n=1 Tax=Dryococelus australis TaxID=614101 RepID=A0ABQ9I1I9_9NEOP|nr:hypothetical protein PR048_010012 [Dryococelus australis]